MEGKLCTCGTLIAAENNTCESCGFRFMQDAKPRGNWAWKVATPLVLGVLLLAAFMMFSRVQPLITAQRALGNFGGEVQTRLQTSPFYAIERLVNNLEDGTTIVRFDYTTRWESIALDLTMQSDSAQNASSFVLDFDFDGIAFDVELMVNPQYVVVRSDILDSQFYGFAFATFGEDFPPFAREMGLDWMMIDVIVDFVESMEEALLAYADGGDAWYEVRDYMNAIRDFVVNSDYSSSRESGITRVEFNFDEADVVQLLWNLFEVFENDENVRDAINEMGFMSFREIVREVRNAVRMVEEELVCDITLVLYVGSRNRLNRLEFELEFEVDMGETEAGIQFVLDMGTTALDDWRAEFTVLTNGEVEVNGYALWTIEEDNGRYTNALRFSDHEESMTFASVWNSNSGSFTLSFEEYTTRWGYDSGSTGGVFQLDDNGGFRLTFDDLGDASLEIESRATSDIQFPSSFVGIDRWADELLERLEEAVMDMLFGW